MSELQKKLEESLREIKVINDVVRLFNLLISFKKLLKETRQVILHDTLSNSNTDTGNLLNNFKLLFDLTHDFSKNVTEKRLSNILKQQDDLSSVLAQAQSPEEKTLDDLRHLTFSADFSENFIERRSLDILKKQDDLTDVFAHIQGLEGENLDDVRLQTCSEDFSESPIEKGSSDNLKNQDDLTYAFAQTQGLEGKTLDDLRLLTCSEDFSENPIEKGFYDVSKQLTDSTHVFSKHAIEKRTIEKLKLQRFHTYAFSRHATEKINLDKLKRLTFPTYVFSKNKYPNVTKEFFNVSAEANNYDNLKHLIDPIDAFSENVREKKTYDGLIRTKLPNCYISKKTIEKKLLDLLKTPGQNRHIFSEALSKLIYRLYRCGGRRDLREPLRTIIKATETVIIASSKYCKYDSQPPFHKDTESLNVLKIGICIVNHSCDAKAEDILNLILRIGSRHADLTKSDKKIIGNLMVNAIDPVELYIKSVFRTYRSRSYTSILRKKSALQIMFDDYAKLTSDEDASKNSEYQKIKNSIEVLDKINKNWCDDSGDSESDLESGYASDRPK